MVHDRTRRMMNDAEPHTMVFELNDRIVWVANERQDDDDELHLGRNFIYECIPERGYPYYGNSGNSVECFEEEKKDDFVIDTQFRVQK